MMRVLVTGGRDYVNHVVIYGALDYFHEHHIITELAHGNARGADTIAKQWALAHRVEQIPFDPKWGSFGARAGILRNITMHDSFKPDLVVAFPGHNGTAHMVSHARSHGTPVVQFNDESDLLLAPRLYADTQISGMFDEP